MITSNIGKIFLDAYNEEYGTNYTSVRDNELYLKAL